jgi:hypothetical protein
MFSIRKFFKLNLESKTILTAIEAGIVQLI